MVGWWWWMVVVKDSSGEGPSFIYNTVCVLLCVLCSIHMHIYIYIYAPVTNATYNIHKPTHVSVITTTPTATIYLYI